MAGSCLGLGPTISGVPVSLIQDEHLDATQVKGRAVVEVIDESARGGDEDVRRCPKSCFLRLHVQAACREQSPPGSQFSQLPGLTEPCHLPGLTPDAEGTAANKTD